MADFHPLSFNQELMLAFGAEAGFGATQWNDQIVFDLNEYNDADVREVLRQLSLRHDILRTRIGIRGGRHCQVVDEPLEWVPHRIADVAHSGPEAIAAAELATPFELHECPLFRSVALPRADGGGWLILTLNHLVSDLQSEVMLADEFTRRYERPGSPNDVTPAPDQYADFARWQRTQVAHYLRDPSSAPQWSTYENAVRKLEPPRAADSVRLRGAAAPPGVARREVVLELSSADTEALIAYGRSRKATLNILFLAAFATAISRLPDLAIGLLLGEKTIRYPYRFRETLGPFPDPWPISSFSDGEFDFSSTLSSIRDNVIQAIEVSLPFHVLVGRTPWLMRELRNDSRAPWVFYQYFNESGSPAERHTRTAHVDIPDGFGKQSDAFGIHLLMRFRNGLLGGRLSYQADSFGQQEIVAVVNEIQDVLCRASGQPISLQVKEATEPPAGTTVGTR